nr:MULTISPECIES: amidohydrolase family protein [Myxococcaceae]
MRSGPALPSFGVVIIDSHTHLNRYSAEEPASAAERLALLRAQLEASGVSRALVLGSYAVTPERPGTQELLALVGDDPRFGVVGGVRLGRAREGAWGEELAELRALLRGGRLRGLKIYPGYEPYSAADPELHPVYALAREFRVPVMVHTGDTYARGARVRLAHPLTVDEAAVAFPEVTFVLCHLGNPWFTDAMEVVYKNENVVADISGITLGAFTDRFARLVRRQLDDVLAYLNDPTKLLFGSDWPLSDIPSYLQLVDTLELTPEEREGLLWRNAARVFGWEQELAGAGDAR